LLGQVAADCSIGRSVKVIRYKFFEELNEILFKELKEDRYAAIIHSAAVSDYKVKRPFKHKVSSGIKNWRLELSPAPKLVDKFKGYGKDLIKAAFKFEPELKGSGLLREGKKFLKKAGLDFVVANSATKKGYLAYIISRFEEYGPYLNKKEMVKNLAVQIRKKL